jgi:hypothetical protein
MASCCRKYLRNNSASNTNSQWTATAGTIQITTTTIKSTNTTDNSTKLQYITNIVFKISLLQKENGTQVYETFPFVTIQPLQQHWPSTLIKQ